MTVIIPGYCSIAEVRSAIGLSSSIVSDADIQLFISYAQSEIENMYKTKFGHVDDSGTATAGGASTLTDSGASTEWTTDLWAGWVVWIYSGTGNGQYRQIASNTTTVLTVSRAWDITPDSTSKYRILPLGYIEESVDGDDSNTMVLQYFPLLKLNYLAISDTTVTPANVVQYLNQAKLLLNSACEVTKFSAADAQLVDLRYVYGVYPFPDIIKRLCIILAGMRGLAAQAGGAYASVNSVSFPGGLSVNKGDPHARIKGTVEMLKNEANNIIENVYRPFTVFG